MTWQYHQSSGNLDHDGQPVGVGYSGAGECKNDPDAQDRHNEGPIPRGRYTIEPPQDTVSHGPYVLRLVPDEANDMEGRGNFLLHGDSKLDPGNASQGCIILPRKIREIVWNSGDNLLEVV